MTKEQLIKHLSNMATLAGVDPAKVEVVAQSASEIGFMEFWNCRSWSFRAKEGTLTLTTTANEYDLPSDFRGIRGLSERSSLHGWNLRYLGKEEFDYEFPNQSVIPSQYPRIYTVYRGSGKFKIKFAPNPPAMTLYIDYLTGTPGDVTLVPEEAVGALIAVCEKYIYPARSGGRAEATKVAQVEVADLENRDSVFGGTLYRIFDNTDYQVDTTRPWI